MAFFGAVEVVPWQRYSVIMVGAHVDTSTIEAETYPVPGMRRKYLGILHTKRGTCGIG